MFANLVIPVPSGTSDISNLLDGGKNTGSLNQVISLVAGHTESVSVISIALIGDWNANSVVVEDPVGRALFTDLVIPIPGGASDI